MKQNADSGGSWRVRGLCVLALSIGIAGCTGFPDLMSAKTEASRAAAYPELSPIDALITEGQKGSLDAASGDALAVRAARLRAGVPRRGVVAQQPTSETAERLRLLRLRATALRAVEG